MNNDGDLDNHHCNDSNCVMEQIDIDGRPSLSEKTKILIQNKKILCPDCQGAFQNNLKRFGKISEVIFNRVFNSKKSME